MSNISLFQTVAQRIVLGLNLFLESNGVYEISQIISDLQSARTSKYGFNTMFLLSKEITSSFSKLNSTQTLLSWLSYETFIMKVDID